MLTDEGRIYIKRYLAGWVPRIAASIAYGIGEKAESAIDKTLQFEMGRADILITSYDFVTNKVIFKAPLPEGIQGKIYEVGLFSMEKNALAAGGDSRIFTTFDSATENWTNPADGTPSTFNSTNTRIGDDSLRLSPAVSTTVSAMLDGIGLDLTEFSSADKFALAWNQTANVASITVDLMNDLSNYFRLSFTPATGYRIVAVPLSSATLTGAPSWSNINMIRVNVTASAGGSATVDLDGLRLEDVDTPNPEYVMISRELLSVPFVKEAGRSQAIEFAIDASIV